MYEPSRPVLWKADPLDKAEAALEIHATLHREAGKRGFYCSPKRSAINRGFSYYAEINQHAWEGRPEYSGLVRPNVAYGTGKTPLLAAVAGYKLAGLNDSLMLAIYLEIEAYYLVKAVKTIGRLELAIEDLEGILSAMSRMTTPIDEDDDL